MPLLKRTGSICAGPTVAIIVMTTASLAFSHERMAQAVAGNQQDQAVTHRVHVSELHVPKKSHPENHKKPAVEIQSPSAMFAPPPGEIKKFGAWTVTCLPQAKAGAQRACMAKMDIIKSKEDPRPILIANLIRSGGATTFVLQTPTGVDLGPGVTVKLGEAAVRKLNYVSCEPALCTSAVLLDDALAQELISAPKVNVAWMGLGIGEVEVEFEAKESKDTIAFLNSK